MCGNGCRVFEFENGICRLYENFLVTVSANSNQVIEARMKHLRGSQNLQNVLMGPEILVFRQDSSDEIFWPQDVIALNKENTSALRYSILDEISNLRRKDGSFHFKLCYPGNYIFPIRCDIQQICLSFQGKNIVKSMYDILEVGGNYKYDYNCAFVKTIACVWFDEEI